LGLVSFIEETTQIESLEDDPEDLWQNQIHNEEILTYYNAPFNLVSAILYVIWLVFTLLLCTKLREWRGDEAKEVVHDKF
jgi:hypothetical protein